MKIQKLLFGLSVAAVLSFGLSSAGCGASLDCGSGLVDCGDRCADLSVDADNCGQCGNSCGPDYCDSGSCAAVACVADGESCSSDDDCCALFCASDGNCACIADGDSSTFCNLNSDCCSGTCDYNSGYCVN